MFFLLSFVFLFFSLIFLVLLSLTTITTVLVSGQQHENIIINNNNNNVSNIINSRWSNYPIYNNHNDNGVDVHSSSSPLSSLSSSLLPKHFKLLSSPLITQTSAIQSSLSSSNQNQFINVDEFRTNISKQFNFICNTQFGYYPDPGNCSSYYICSFGIPLHKNCSKGLYFSIRLQTCDWPANVQCEQGLCFFWLFLLNFFSFSSNSKISFQSPKQNFLSFPLFYYWHQQRTKKNWTSCFFFCCWSDVRFISQIIIMCSLL